MDNPACSLDYLARNRSSSFRRSRRSSLQRTQPTRKLTTLSPRARSDKVNRINSRQPAASPVRQAPLLVSRRRILAKAPKSRHRRTTCQECSTAIISSKERIISPHLRTRNRSNTTTNTWRARSCLVHRKATRRTAAASFRQVKAVKSRPMVPRAQRKVKAISLDR